jgi:hypothetical protein
MATLIVANNRKVVCEYKTGRVEAAITPQTKNRFTYLIRTVKIQGATSADLVDFAQALRLTAKQTGKVVGIQRVQGPRSTQMNHCKYQAKTGL